MSAVTVESMDQALSLLERAVAERGPDTLARFYEWGGSGDATTYTEVERDVNRSVCVYFNPVTAEPECIIGLALSYEGLTASDVSPDEQRSTVLSVITGQTGLSALTASDSVLRVLRRAQSAQDAGLPWSESLANARAEAELRRKVGIGY